MGILRVSVIPGGLPLLWSRSATKMVGARDDPEKGVLDFPRLGVQPVPIQEAGSSHPLINLFEFPRTGWKPPEGANLAEDAPEIQFQVVGQRAALNAPAHADGLEYKHHPQSQSESGEDRSDSDSSIAEGLQAAAGGGQPNSIG